MIISQTPYRVSFAGGGTDLPAFYRQEFGDGEPPHRADHARRIHQD